MWDVLLLLMAGCDDGGGGPLLPESPQSRKQPLGNAIGQAAAAGDGIDFAARWRLRLSARRWFGQRAGKCVRRQYRLFCVCGLMIKSDTDRMNVFRMSAQKNFSFTFKHSNAIFSISYFPFRHTHGPVQHLLFSSEDCRHHTQRFCRRCRLPDDL